MSESPTWTPLAPRRLANLANALGVSTPLPASLSHQDRVLFQNTSRFLLHVVPPPHLPHDSKLPVPDVSGYHAHFRRGTLVPVHSTLQAQLGAIAREYALPSTVGMVLYLVSTSPVEDSLDEPGPRLSEDIWKHLWTRVLRTEQRDDLLMPSRSPTPHTPHSPLTLLSAARSTPFLPHENSSQLRPFLSIRPNDSPLPHLPPHLNSPVSAAPSSASSISDLRSANNKSAPPSSVSRSEPGTPDTSIEDAALRSNSIDLPGLKSPSLIPILAKVEFDIDKKKAGWYEPWLRSRRANYAKRTHVTDDDQERKPIELLTGKKKPLASFKLGEPIQDSAGYAPLVDSPQNSDSEEEEGLGEDVTAKINTRDPLADVFGTDEDNWANMRAGSKKVVDNPNIVPLALTGEELDALPESENDDDHLSTKEEEEVRDLLDKMSPPNAVRKNAPPPLVLVPKDKSAATVISTAVSTPNPLSADVRLAYLGGSDSQDEEDHDLDKFTRVRSPEESEKRVGAVFDDLDLGLDPTEDFDDNDPNDRRRSQFLMKAQLDEIERTMAQLSPRFIRNELDEEPNLSFNTASLSPSSPAKLTLSPGSLRSYNGPPSPRLPKHPDPPENQLRDMTGQSWPAVPFLSIKDSNQNDPNRPPSPPRLALNGITTSAPKSYMPSRQPTSGLSESERRRKELEEEQALHPPNMGQRTQPGSSQSPIIPLSPDPFGRYPSDPSQNPEDGQWATMTIGRGETLVEDANAGPSVPGRARSATTSRFSSDSITGEDINNAKPTTTRTALISVKGIKNLWRKSNNSKSSQGSSSQVVPPTPTLPSSGRNSPMVGTTLPPSGRNSPMVAPPPQRPGRPSEEHMDFIDVSVPPPTNFGRISPQPPQGYASQPPPNPRRPSQDQPHYMPPPSRTSMDQMGPPPQQQMYQSQLAVPNYAGRSNGNGTANVPPIITSHMQPVRGPSLDRLLFDQQSPYPVRVSSAPRQSPRPPSPPPLPAIPEQEKDATRKSKSILKWKSGGSNPPRHSSSSSSSTSSFPYASSVHSISEQQQQPQQVGQGRTSFERPGSAQRGRRPSVINFGSTRSSVTTPDMPTTPPIPQQFVNGNQKGANGYDAHGGANGGLDYKTSQRSRLTVSSTESSSPPQRQSSLTARSNSPPRSSMASSRDSGPSFDASQFEFVSPKGAVLGYPYTTMDR